ncbi:MAG TPA: hypothetical protein VGS58_03960 [Candidatus Sulfopaludibacter sp.]|nr:hypothetical protein [Candidatus Sulfopaludibacter sp.]
MKSFLIAFTLAAAACAQPALGPPLAGYLQDGANSLRPVFGIAGNFVLGGSSFSGVSSAAYSGSFGLLKTDTSVIAVDRQGQVLGAMDAPAGPADFAFFSDGSPAFIYLPGPNLLLAWYGAGFQMLPFDCQLFPSSAVVAVSAPDRAHVAFLIQRDHGLGEVRVLSETGEADSQEALPGVDAPALRLSTGELIYPDANGIVIRKADATEIHLNARLPASFAWAQMGAGWVELRDLASSARSALRVTPGHEGLYLLPEVSQ